MHAEIPNTPVDVRIKDIQTCYSRKNEKLVLGQRHASADPKKSRKRGKSKKDSRRNNRSRSPGKGESLDRTNTFATGEFPDMQGSVSMLSIGSVIEEFKSLMSQELSSISAKESLPRPVSNSVASLNSQSQSQSQLQSQSQTQPQSEAQSISQSQSQDLFDSGNSQTSTIKIAPLRGQKKAGKYNFEKVKLYCRFPKCTKEFKHAFDLYVHTRKEHGHLTSQPFKEPVGPQATRPHTTGTIDPFHKRPASRSNCSGILPAVPRSRPPSPDATGVVWPAEVLQQQSKWQENMDAESLRVHARELQLVNMRLTLDLKKKGFALNKSTKEMSPHKRVSLEKQQMM